MPFHLIKWGLSLEGIKLTRFTLLFSAQGKFSIFMGFVALTLCSAQPLLATPAPTVALLALPSISETFLKSFILLCVVLRRRNMNSNRWSQILWLPTPLLQCFSTMLTVLSSLRLIVTFHYDPMIHTIANHEFLRYVLPVRPFSTVLGSSTICCIL